MSELTLDQMIAILDHLDKAREAIANAQQWAEALRALPRYSIRKEDERILLVADSIANQSGPWVKWADVAALLPPQEEKTDVPD
jgi:hypothetical protein